MAESASLYVHAQSITTGGTPQKVLDPGSGLAPSDGPVSVQSAIIKARKSNTSPLYLGNATTGGGTNGSGLSATTGFELQPGDAIDMDIMGLGNGWIVGATTGDRYDIVEV